MKHFSLILFAIFISACTPKSRLQQIGREKAGIPSVTPKPNRTISKSEDKQIIEIDRKSKNLNPPTPLEGNLIQTGGVVMVLARQLTIDLNVSGSNVSQILAMQNYIQNNWHYIHDPKRDKDTWRSAEATIELRYKGKFPGDCDDFAILMASLARQIGLESRMLGGFHNREGHAFAEFKVPLNEYQNRDLINKDIRKVDNEHWVSLDWFIGDSHNKYTEDIIIYEDI